MLMMCWFYCVPFAKGLFFAFSPLLILFSLFVLKRGIRQSRLGLRQMAFLLMFVAILKAFTVDVYYFRDTLLCETGFFKSACSADGFKALQIAGLMALMLGSLALFNAYRSFVRNGKQLEFTPEQAGLRFWVNLSMSLVVLLVLWILAPWVGYLTVGHVPKLFTEVPWQYFAMLNVIILLVGFWKMEDCNWSYDPTDKTKKKHLARIWTPKDTLWLSVILYLITLAFSYASSDVLSASPSRGGSHLSMDKIDFSKLDGMGFQMPPQQ